ncbi:MAG: LuxR C-terminal-related transcriptional regulator [Ferruginibacter sp.]
MSVSKMITYTSLLNDPYYRSKDIDSREVLNLLRQAEAIPQKLLPFKGCIHVIDYTQRRHVGLSGPVKNMIGYDPRDVINDGLDFVIDIFQKDDFKIYNEIIFSQIVGFFKKMAHDEHAAYIFSFTYRMKKADGKWMHLYQQGSYITDPKTSLPLFAIGMSTDISPLKKDTCMIFSIDKKATDEGVFNYKNILTNYYYPDPEESRLSRREREIVAWLSEGLSSKQIAQKLFLSESTIVNHRKNMLKKANVKNVAELILYAVNRGVI